MATAGAAWSQNLSPATTPPPLLQTGTVGGRAGLRSITWTTEPLINPGAPWWPCAGSDAPAAESFGIEQ